MMKRRIAIVTGYHLVEILKQKGAIVRIKKANAILKRPINKLFPTEYTYDTNQTDKVREQKLRWEGAVTDQLNRKYCVNIGREEEPSDIANINLLNRFNKTWEIFPRVTWVLSNLLTTIATSASVERVNSKEHVPKDPCSIAAASYAQRWALCSNNPANI